MRKILVILTLVMVAAVPLLSSCDSADIQEIINTAKLWAMVHDITDTDGNVNYGAAARFGLGNMFGLASTGDNEGDAAIDSVKALNEIREADDAAQEGWNNLYAGHNVDETVIPQYNSAVNLRKDDWTYRNDRGVAYLEDINAPNYPNNVKLANADFNKAASLAKQSKKSGEYLRMLKQREQSMARLVQHDNETHAMPTVDILNEQSRTYGELYKLTGEKNYLLLKQQTDTNLSEGHYWRVETTK
jgi:hypothetical protein